VRPQPAQLPRREPGANRVAGPTDAELLGAVAVGSEPAFEELRRRYLGVVERACRSLGAIDVEDCAQEVFARIWRKARLFDPTRGTPAAWLLTVARSVASNLRAKRVPDPQPLADVAAAEDPPMLDRFWLDAALERLPRQERTVIELAYFEDRSQSAIASDLGVPLGSVKSWTRRGLNRLATLLGDEGPE
jgi:RNA polymerase sigma-70 factor (ECF subfamily)